MKQEVGLLIYGGINSKDFYVGTQVLRSVNSPWIMGDPIIPSPSNNYNWCVIEVSSNKYKITIFHYYSFTDLSKQGYSVFKNLKFEILELYKNISHP